MRVRVGGTERAVLRGCVNNKAEGGVWVEVELPSWEGEKGTFLHGA